jgi:polysaccharide biosynthesis/export protein
MLQRYFPYALFVFAGFILSGCGSVKLHQMVMLTDVESEIAKIDSLPVLRIRPDDIISIQVASRDPETVLAFQQQKLASTGSGASSGENALGIQEGYRVDEEGNIYLPFIGKQSVEGKTLIQLRESITEELVKYIPDASVQVRFMNFRVTLLGEVFKPNTYIIPNERLTILEAIGMAGDFTPYADRISVLVVRERNNVREFARINTQDKTLFLSPYFYLSPNDIVYVEPLKAKQYATQGDFFERYAVVLVSMVSLITFVLSAVL